MNTLQEISIDYHPTPTTGCNKVMSSAQGFELLRSNWPDDLYVRERFYALYLNRGNKVLGVSLISVGGMSATIADVRLIFATGLKCLASSIILAHNHPSGRKQASASDIALTKKITEAGKILDILVMDHLIVTPEYDYFSFADEGLL